MRTTLIIPDALMDEARETLGFTSKTDTVVHALREVVRKGRRENLLDVLKRVKFDADPLEMRRKERRRLDRR
ncbi:MAG TPA: type II toxin-antitoxin system VapB family antitoxin [Vicinamibacterales bacterium]|nr:type II toxin-antitoxin system VapB family antitoxin [Vicinamibacterales bacterium]